MPARSPNQGGLVTLYALRCWICLAQSPTEGDPHSASRTAALAGWHEDRNYPLRPECPQCHNPDGLFAAHPPDRKAAIHD